MHAVQQRLLWLGRCYGVLTLTLAGGALISVGQAATAPIYITGTITSKPQCVINSNQAIRVDFGDDLVTTKVDGSNYIRPVDYTLECRNNSKNAMKMKVVGTAAAFNGSAIQSSKANLAIALRANGNPLTIGSWLNFTYPNKPLLQAVPVKGRGALTAGAFSAAATLMVDYQ
ncbi:putative minor fimbrial subunit StfF [Serratia marcescens]|uniref:fimbrial protein n=1 Tax=Serratia marcescens TaxID=615 RepID=UPI00217AB956|nr:fimbrial protein [Serratia marcescens]CAI1818517.1 putative minor fimbrial subunit StfF [Serratia marcescens]